jgi:PadR family transcriptional regulator, regulatory protein AphA
LQEDLRLSPTSYIVLGLLDGWEEPEATPYDLKQRLAVSVDNFWSTPHAQVYREPERLAAGGYVTERREQTGRRRRFYAITDRGRVALQQWRDEAPDDAPELRDAGVLKLFFDADPRTVADHQLTVHRAKLAEYEELRETVVELLPPGQARALEFGIAFERALIALWKDVGEG